jgi:succinate-acetate transporter protein
MFFGTLNKNRALQFVFMSLTILFFLLTIRDYAFGVGNTDIGNNVGTFLGYEGVICGLSAVYLGLAEVLNEAHGKTILPIGTMQK